MTACLGKSRSLGLPFMSFMNVYQFYVCVSIPFDFEAGSWI